MAKYLDVFFDYKKGETPAVDLDIELQEDAVVKFDEPLGICWISGVPVPQVLKGVKSIRLKAAKGEPPAPVKAANPGAVMVEAGAQLAAAVDADELKAEIAESPAAGLSAAIEPPAPKKGRGK